MKFGRKAGAHSRLKRDMLYYRFHVGWGLAVEIQVTGIADQ